MWLGRALLILAALGAPRSASAECATPPMWIGLPAGSEVPPQGTLYVYAVAEWPRDVTFWISWHGGAGASRIARVSEDLVRIDYAAVDATGFDIVHDRKRYSFDAYRWHYTIDPAWHPPSRAPRVVSVLREKERVVQNR